MRPDPAATPKRVTILTAGQLSTCPRMLKAADALAGAGHRVRVISTRHTEWAADADTAIAQSRQGRWIWHVVDYGRRSSPLRYLWTGARRRLARVFARTTGVDALPLAVLARASSRAHDELVKAAIAAPTDLIYGGTNAAIAAAAIAGRILGVPFALDLEDFYSGENGNNDPLADGMARRVEEDVLREAAFLTAGSRAIAEAYSKAFGVEATPLHNTFPLPPDSPVKPEPGTRPLRLYWFSQTIGPGRGLEDAIQATGLAEIPGELHLRGVAIPRYLDRLERLASSRAPGLRLIRHDPAPPDRMADLCGGYDVGLALERLSPPNRALCVTNKLFTYMLGGLAIAMTDTPGQRELARDLGIGALVYRPGDIEALAAGLRRWARDRDALAAAKRACWSAAKERWHWEHELERGALLQLVDDALSHAPQPQPQGGA